MSWFWLIPVVAILGHYYLESKKIDLKKSQVDTQPFSIPKSEISTFLGIKEEDVEAFLDKHKDQLHTSTINDTVYYKVDSLRKAFS